MEMALRDAIRRGIVRGPRLVLAGKIVSMTTPGCLWYPGMYREADGADEVRKAAREQLKMGADLVKLMATAAAFAPGRGSRERPVRARGAARGGGRGTQAEAPRGSACRGRGRHQECRPRWGGHDRARGLPLPGRGGDGDDARPGHASRADADPLRRRDDPPRRADAGVHQAQRDEDARGEHPVVPPRRRARRADRDGDRRRRLVQPARRQRQRALADGALRDDARPGDLRVVAGPARALRLASELGSVEPGKAADLVLVAGDLATDVDLLLDPDNVKLVVQAGEVVADRSDEALAKPELAELLRR